MLRPGRRRSNLLFNMEIATSVFAFAALRSDLLAMTAGPMRFSSPPNPQAYYAQVWDLVRQVPRGRVATYGQIALMLPPPAGVDFESYKAFGPRWVGGAMAACPDDVPWQRVINSEGKISQRPGAERQRLLLEEEGVEFVKDKIDLKKYGWKGLDEADQPRQETLF